MAMSSSSVLFFYSFLVLFSSVVLPGVHGIGVNYGLLGDNLPDPVQTLELLRTRNIKRIRIFEPNQAVLNALHGFNTEVYIGVKNKDLQPLATDASFATTWVQTNILPHVGAVAIPGITAGNEVIPGPLAEFVVGAMNALDGALRAANITVPVSTVVSYGIMGNSYPPSTGSFSVESAHVMTEIATFLQSRGYPLLANIYPYFAYISNVADISSNYAFFTADQPVVRDGGLLYSNLFDSMVDGLYSALERVKAPSIDIVVSETGWPSAGDQYANMANAQLYNQNLVKHVESGMGTPKRPNKKLETYIFAVFNENLKPAGTEQNFGLYYPNLKEVYHVEFP